MRTAFSKIKKMMFVRLKAMDLAHYL